MKHYTSVKIFVVDDDLFCLNMYQQHIRNLGYTDVQGFDNGAACLENLYQQPEVIFLDHSMDTLDGIDVLKLIKRFDPDIYVVFVSGQEDIQLAFNSLKSGAFDYILKDTDEMRRIGKILEKIEKVRGLLKKRSPGLVKRIFMFF